MEGLIGEYYGFIFLAKKSPQLIIKVNAIIYQSNPIVLITVAGCSLDKTHTVWAISICAKILNIL